MEQLSDTSRTTTSGCNWNTISIHLASDPVDIFLQKPMPLDRLVASTTTPTFQPVLRKAKPKISFMSVGEVQ